MKTDAELISWLVRAMVLHILRIGPVQANSVSGGLDGDICGRYRALFNGVGLLKE